jgi:hypothetical protein
MTAAHAGSALWPRRPDSGDLVFADLMPWGWLRRAWTEHRIGRTQRILGLSQSGMDWERLSAGRRVELLERPICLLEARDVHTLGHTRRVARHAERIALTMHLPPADVVTRWPGSAQGPHGTPTDRRDPGSRTATPQGDSPVPGGCGAKAPPPPGHASWSTARSASRGNCC